MRRSAFPIALALILVAGCDTAGPLDPPAATPSGASTSIQNDSTPQLSPTEAGDGGIMMGSGT